MRESIAVREAHMDRLQCHLANDNTPALMWVDEEDGFEEDDEVSERQRSRLHMQATTVLQLYKLWNEREQAQLASLEHQPGSTHEEKGQGVQEVGGDDGTAREVFQNVQVFAEEAGKMLVPPIHGRRTVQEYHSEWVANAERSESGDGCFNMDRRGKAECVWILDEEDKKRQFTVWMSKNAKTLTKLSATAYVNDVLLKDIPEKTLTDIYRLSLPISPRAPARSRTGSDQSL